MKRICSCAKFDLDLKLLCTALIWLSNQLLILWSSQMCFLAVILPLILWSLITENVGLFSFKKTEYFAWYTEARLMLCWFIRYHLLSCQIACDDITLHLFMLYCLFYCNLLTSENRIVSLLRLLKFCSCPVWVWLDNKSFSCLCKEWGELLKLKPKKLKKPPSLKLVSSLMQTFYLKMSSHYKEQQSGPIN